MESRDLEWDGCWNTRDLGGLPTVDGRRVRSGALVRSASLHHVGPPGWAAVEAHGIRTIVDLRDAAQVAAEPVVAPPTVTTVQVPIEEGLDDDPEFAWWARTGRICTPLYYRRFIERWPDRCAAAVVAVARAEPGGVLVHCRKGCDRTGLVVLLALAAVGVPGDEIISDYERTAERVAAPAARRLGVEDDAQLIRDVLDREGASVRSSMFAVLGGVGPVVSLRSGGVTEDDIAALRARLLD